MALGDVIVGAALVVRAVGATVRANQLRLWFAAMAHVLLCALRRVGLAHTQFAEAPCGTLRLALLKVGALVTVSVRRIRLAMAPAHPYQNESDRRSGDAKVTKL